MTLLCGQNINKEGGSYITFRDGSRMICWQNKYRKHYKLEIINQLSTQSYSYSNLMKSDNDYWSVPQNVKEIIL